MNQMRTPLALLGAVIVLTACTRPAGGAPPADLAQTAVAATLTAAPAAAIYAPAQVSPTPPPSATPVLTPTPEPTLAPTPGDPLTPAAPAAPTLPPLSPDDPRHGIDPNAPHVYDAFNDALLWIGPTFGGAANQVLDGRLRAVDHLTDGYIWWSTTLSDRNAGNLYAEVTAAIGACQGKDAAGMAVRVGGDAFNSGYAYEAACDGSFRIRRFSAGRVDVLLDWTAAGALLPGPDASNRLGFLARGSRLTVFANGQALGAVEDSSFSSGTFGLYASAEQSAGVTVHFDDFALWHLGP